MHQAGGHAQRANFVWRQCSRAKRFGFAGLVWGEFEGEGNQRNSPSTAVRQCCWSIGELLPAERFPSQIIATGLDAKSGQPSIVYQTMLFEGHNYYIMLGMVGSEKREACLPVFEEMGESFRRNQ